jgi:hypothetical protein
MGWVVSTTPRPLYPPGKTRYPLCMRLGRPQGRSGRLRKIAPPPGLDPRSVQPVASHYTDWATRPTHSPYDTPFVIYIYLHVSALRCRPRCHPQGFYLEEIWSPTEHRIVIGLVTAMQKKLHFSVSHKWFWKLILQTFIIVSYRRIERICSISVQMTKHGAV